MLPPIAVPNLPTRCRPCVWAWPADACGLTAADLAPLHPALPSGCRQSAILALLALAEADPTLPGYVEGRRELVKLGVPAATFLEVAGRCGMSRKVRLATLGRLAACGAVEFRAAQARPVLRYDRLLGVQPHPIVGRAGDPADLASPEQPWSWFADRPCDLDQSDPLEGCLHGLCATLSACGLPPGYSAPASLTALRDLAQVYGRGNLAAGLAHLNEVFGVLPQVAKRYPATCGTRAILTPQGFELLEEQWRERNAGGGAWAGLPNY